MFDFEADAMRILDVIRRGFTECFEDFAKAKPQVKLLTFAGALSDYHYCHFSVRKAMQHAWVATVRLGKSHPAELPKKIKDLDLYVMALYKLIYEPGILIGATSKLLGL